MTLVTVFIHCYHINNFFITYYDTSCMFRNMSVYTF